MQMISEDTENPTVRLIIYETLINVASSFP